jgi:hypothetical protein
LGEQLEEGITGPLLRLHDETAAFNRDADLGTRLQAENIEQRRRDGLLPEARLFKLSDEICWEDCSVSYWINTFHTGFLATHNSTASLHTNSGLDFLR